MAGIKNNRRTQYTINVIEEALVTLLTDYPLEKITVAEVCREADVNRGTFYRYFVNIMDCFKTVQKNFFKEMAENDQLFDEQSPEKFLVGLLQTFKNNATLMRSLLTNQSTELLQKFLEHRKSVLNINTEANREGLYEMDFYANGIANVVKRWLLLNTPESPEQMAKIILKIIFTIPDKVPAPHEAPLK
ncbi:TetR/AcrR family transcriptional regulator [Lactiplantibacillus carotarum]|uniref:TetR/AcrR family transcriptional regulator n=1 Tax=Lactiplantibacillus carotarum TaxID=2993456 RepID=UPI00298F1A00|nr:TetR/AcrR family transcriptional regulator [Lactiplantibacillus carotarum]